MAELTTIHPIERDVAEDEEREAVEPDGPV